MKTLFFFSVVALGGLFFSASCNTDTCQYTAGSAEALGSKEADVDKNMNKLQIWPRKKWKPKGYILEYCIHMEIVCMYTHLFQHYVFFIQ